MGSSLPTYGVTTELHTDMCVCVYKQDINTKSERVSIILSYIIYVHTHVYIAVYWLVPQRPNN